MSILLRALIALAAVVTAAGASLVAVAAVAAPVPESGSSGLLTLDADPYPAQNMTIARGDRLLWPVTAELDAPTAGELTVQVAATQPLAEDAAALRFELASCPEVWVLAAGTASCSGGAGTVEIPEAPFATTDATWTWSLGEIVPGEPRFFLVTLSLPALDPRSDRRRAGGSVLRLRGRRGVDGDRGWFGRRRGVRAGADRRHVPPVPPCSGSACSAGARPSRACAGSANPRSRWWTA